MAWTIYIRCGEERLEQLALNWRSALLSSWLLLRQGIDIDRIERRDGLTINVNAIRPLCEETG
jgi:hypothetical protein